jgi:tryptophan 2,3-dioxygenase
MSNVYYPDYLQLDKILGAQAPESDKVGVKAHDEMLFIIIHQAYELWFKQVLYEVSSVMEIFKNKEVDDNGGELNIAVHRLQRVKTILDVLVHQWEIIETMTPLDFLDFRDLLRPPAVSKACSSKFWKPVWACAWKPASVSNTIPASYDRITKRRSKHWKMNPRCLTS